MTMSLQATSSYCTTEDTHIPHRTMISNDVLNAFQQGLVDEDGSLRGDEDDCIDDNGAVDDEKLEVCMARQEAADERKRNLLSILMNIFELEDQEQREFDSLDLQLHREPPFRGLQWKEGETGYRAQRSFVTEDFNNLMENDGTVVALLGTEEIMRNDCDNNDAPLDNKNDA